MSQPALDTHAEVRKLKQAGCPEEQAVVMVDLVSRAPLNAEMAGSLEKVQFRLESIESTIASLATKSDLEILAHRVESIESRLESIESTMATKSDLEILAHHVESIESTMATKTDLKDLRSEMFRMMWIQSGVLGTLIISLAGIMLGLAG